MDDEGIISGPSLCPKNFRARLRIEGVRSQAVNGFAWECDDLAGAQFPGEKRNVTGGSAIHPGDTSLVHGTKKAGEELRPQKRINPVRFRAPAAYCASVSKSASPRVGAWLTTPCICAAESYRYR